MKRVIAVTWHRSEQLMKTLKLRNLNYGSFIEILEDFILSLYKKNKNIIFHIGWSDWMDNIVGEILLKNNIPYVLFTTEKDLGWRWNRDSSEFELFNNIKRNASKINISKWFLKRDREMIKDADNLLMFLDKNRIPKSGTYYTFTYFIKNIYKKSKDIKIKTINKKIPELRFIG